MSRLARLFREALDRVDYVVTVARLWLVDLIFGPEPPTPADKQRELDHDALRKAFPVIDLDGRIRADEEREARVEATPITSRSQSAATSPKSEASAYRPID